jgi:putative ABC transport system permease protein
MPIPNADSTTTSGSSRKPRPGLVLRSPAVLVTILGAVLIAIALLLTPWLDASSAFAGGPPSGMQIPEGFTPSPEMQAQFQQAMAAGALPGGGLAEPLPLWGTVATAAAAGVSLLGVLLVIFRREQEPLRRQLTALAGVVMLVVLVSWVRASGDIGTVLTDANAGWWLAVLGTLLLGVQAVLPRRTLSDTQTGYIRIDVSAISGERSNSMGSINVWQNLVVAFQALAANKLRAALTMLGVIIGVASIVALLAIGQGAQASVTSQIEDIGTNLLTISPVGRPQLLVESDAESITAGIPAVDAVLPEYSGNLPLRAQDTSGTYQTVGVTADYADVRGIEVQGGRFLDRVDLDDNARVVVVGTTIVEELFDGENPIGQNIQINGQRFQVIGVLEQQDQTFGQDPNARVFVPLTTAYRYLFDARVVASNDKRVTTLTVAVGDRDAIDATTAQVEELLRERHNVEPDEDDTFRVSSQGQLLSTITTVTSTFTVLLAALAGVSLVVGGIGIMNISLVSVTERTREIGLRKAIGAKQHHILQQFLIETMVLSALGGLLGVLVGVGLALAVNLTGALTASISWQAIALGLGSSIVTGVFFGVYPATRAAALEPIEALRYE